MDKGLLTKASVIKQQGAQGLIERGLAAVMPKTKLESSLLSTLKSKLDPKSIAGGMLKSAAIKKLGLGWLNPVLGIASLFGFNPMKKAQAAFGPKPTFWTPTIIGFQAIQGPFQKGTFWTLANILSASALPWGNTRVNLTIVQRHGRF